MHKLFTNGFESSIVGMTYALAEYADTHFRRYETKLGQDYVLGAAWEQQVKGLRQLLNGELGRLDAGSVDSILVGMLKREGFES